MTIQQVISSLDMIDKDYAMTKCDDLKIALASLNKAGLYHSYSCLGQAREIIQYVIECEESKAKKLNLYYEEM